MANIKKKLKLYFSLFERLGLHGSSGEGKDSCEYKSAVAGLITTNIALHATELCLRTLIRNLQ